MRVPIQSEVVEWRASYVYELVAAHELPRVDLFRSFQSTFGRSYTADRQRTASSIASSVGPRSSIAAAATRKTMRTNAGYLIGIVLCITMPWLSTGYGRPIAIAAVVLIFPGFVADLRRARYDIVLLLVKMYDFWYFMSVNTVSCILLALHFNDARAIIVLVPWMGNLLCTLVDASTHMVRQMIISSIIGIIVCSNLLVCVQLRLIDAAVHFPIAEYGNRAIFVEDAITNGLATSLVLLSRNIYRRIRELARRRQQTNRSHLVQCINYRCAVKLQLLRQHQDTPSSVPATTRRKSRSRARSETLAQMAYVREDATYDAADTFLPIRVGGWRSWQRVVLRCIFFAGMLLPVVGALLVSTLGQARWVFGAAFACSQTIATLTWALSQKQLYWKIVLTFDYLFLFFQLSSMHACACDMVAWDIHCVGIVSLWLFIHVVVTADALTPVVRKQIGLNSTLLALPVAAFIILQAAYLYKLAVGGPAFQDRLLFHGFIGSRQIEVHVVPFFISRLSTTFVWSFRLLWRIVRAKDDELVLLRGKVANGYAILQHAIVPVAPSD